MSDPSAHPSLARKLVAEAFGTAMLLTVIIGAGIMAEKLAGGNIAVALLGTTAPIAALLYGLIVVFGPISGAHFNPAVTVAVAMQKGIPWMEVPAYIAVQVIAAIGGTALANLMFGHPALFLATQVRSGPAQWVSEFVATFGLLAMVWGSARVLATALPTVVAAYIFAACWFTPSTCFANPAVTIARALSNTFCGIRPEDVPAFIVFQLLGAAAATLFMAWLVPGPPAEDLDRMVHQNHPAGRGSAPLPPLPE